jgi:hypothetical protein
LNGRAFAGVQEPKLNAGGIGSLRHEAAERVYFSHQMALRDPSYRRVAGHAPDRAPVRRHERRCKAAQGKHPRGFNARVPASDHDTIIPHRILRALLTVGLVPISRCKTC